MPGILQDTVVSSEPNSPNVIQSMNTNGNETLDKNNANDNVHKGNKNNEKVNKEEENNVVNKDKEKKDGAGMVTSVLSFFIRIFFYTKLLC